MYLATKIILALTFLLLLWAIGNFVSRISERRREAKEIKKLQESNEIEETPQ